MKAKALVVTLTVLLLAGSLGFALAPRAASADLSGAFGGDLKVALQGFGELDPRTAIPADKKVLELVYDSLGKVDPISLQIEPWAATSWGWDGDKNITVTLRDDLTFSDGAAYDADDVAYSLSQYKKAGVSRWVIAVEDAHTLRFNFTAIPPWWNYKNDSSNQAGPGLFFTEGLTAMIAWDAAGNLKYSGPFAVDTFDDVNGELVLVANEHHFRGRPYLDSVTYRWPYTVAIDPSTNRTVANDAGCALMFGDVHLIGWQLLANDLTNARDCVASHGGFPDLVNRSLLNPDPALSVPFVLTAKNPGTDFLYFGISYNAGSSFVGAPGSAGQKLRSAIYLFVNKGLYRDIEPNTIVTHGLQSRLNPAWAPTSCPPFTPCDAIIDASTEPAPSPITRRTNIVPGMQALDQAGYLDRNGDGLRETATGAPLPIRLLAPSFALDARKTTIFNDFESQLRAGGLNASVEQFSSWAAIDAAAAACTTNCIYIKRFTGATQLPDWIYTMPEIVNAGDTLADLHLNLGAATDVVRSFTYEGRLLHVGHVSHYVGAAADFMPVLHFDALEAYNFVDFTGWVNTFAGINNFWSFVSLRLPPLGSLSAKVSIFPDVSLLPGGTTTVQAEARDAVGQVVSGATVTLSVPAGLGGFEVSPGTFAATITGTTDAQGTFAATYQAPSVASGVTDVWVSAVATKTQYAGTTATGTLSVHAPSIGELSVSVSRGAANEILSGGTATITVTASDANGDPVSGAFVVVRADLPGASFTPAASGTTDGSGVFTATFTATVKQGMTYRITAEVSKAGYAEATGGTALAVKSDLGVVIPIDVTRNVPGFEATAVIGAIAVVFVFATLLRRRRED